MVEQSGNCALLADCHHALTEGVRSLLATSFRTVFAVSDEGSLLEGIEKLGPNVVLIDLSLPGGRGLGLLASVHERAPGAKVVVLTVHDEESVARAVLALGADAVVLKRTISTDLLAAVDAVLANTSYVSPGIGAGRRATAAGRPD